MVRCSHAKDRNLNTRNNSRSTICCTRVSLWRAGIGCAPVRLQLDNLYEHRSTARRRIHLDNRDEDVSVWASRVCRPVAPWSCRRSILLHLQDFSSHHLHGNCHDHARFERPCGTSRSAYARPYSPRASRRIDGWLGRSFAYPHFAFAAHHFCRARAHKRGVLLCRCAAWEQAR